MELIQFKIIMTGCPMGQPILMHLYHSKSVTLSHFFGRIEIFN